MPFTGKSPVYGSDFAARRTRGKTGCEGRQALPKAECSRVIHALCWSVIHDRELFGYIEEHLAAFYDPLSAVSSAVSWRVGYLEKRHAVDNTPMWLVGEYGARLIRRLCQRVGRECALPGLALEVSYAYLDGLFSVNEWVRVLRLLDRLQRPLTVSGLETKLAQSHDIQPDRPILAPAGLGCNIELYRVDPVLFRHAALLVKDWQHGCGARPGRIT